MGPYVIINSSGKPLADQKLGKPLVFASRDDAELLRRAAKGERTVPFSRLDRKGTV